jgi:predicted flavoprotein YhiN
MKFELEFLEEFINKECRKTKKHSSTSLIPDYSKKRFFIEQEVERIKKSFTNQLFQIENESRIELFIQHHQAHIIRLADRVSISIEKEEPVEVKTITAGHTRLNLCKVILQALKNY